MQDAPLGEAPTNLPICEQPKRADTADCNRLPCIVGLCVPDTGADHDEAHRSVKLFLAVNGRAGVGAECNLATCLTFRFFKVSGRSGIFGAAFDCDDDALM